MTEPLPGQSLVLYRIFAEASGRWSTPQWVYGVDERPRWVSRAYKEMTLDAEPVKMISI